MQVKKKTLGSHRDVASGARLQGSIPFGSHLSKTRQLGNQAAGFSYY
jgi:hypothetical protein